jgi:hypothetical protein
LEGRPTLTQPEDLVIGGRVEVVVPFVLLDHPAHQLSSGSWT